MPPCAGDVAPFRFPWRVAVLLVLGTTACGSPGVTDTTPGPSTTQAGWQEPERVATAGRVREDAYSGLYPPHVALALDARGRGWAVWTRLDPPRVEGARLDGAWAAPVTLRDCGAVEDGVPGLDCANVAAASSESGRVVAAWTERHGGEWTCRASEWRDGAWTEASRVQGEPTGQYVNRGRGITIARGPIVSLDAGGHAWMFWWRAPATTYPRIRTETLRTSYSPPAGGWSVEDTLEADAGFGANGPAAVALPGGERLVTWGVDEGVRSALLSPARRWRSGEVARTGWTTFGPAVAALPGGDALVSWAGYSLSDRAPQGLSLARLTPDLRVEAPVVVADTGRDAAVVAVSSTGTVFAVWPVEGGIAARSGPRAGEPLGPVRVIAVEGQADGIQVAAEPSGGALVAWRDGTWDGGPRVAAARVRSEGGWSEARTLFRGEPSSSYTVTPPSLAVDARGDAVVVFSDSPPATRDVGIYAVRYRPGDAPGS